MGLVDRDVLGCPQVAEVDVAGASIQHRRGVVIAGPPIVPPATPSDIGAPPPPPLVKQSSVGLYGGESLPCILTNTCCTWAGGTYVSTRIRKIPVSELAGF